MSESIAEQFYAEAAAERAEIDAAAQDRATDLHFQGLAAWAEVSARIGSMVLEAQHKNGWDTMVLRRTTDADGVVYYAEPLVVPEYPEPKRSLWSRFRDWRSRSWSRVPQRWM